MRKGPTMGKEEGKARAVILLAFFAFVFIFFAFAVPFFHCFLFFPLFSFFGALLFSFGTFLLLLSLGFLLFCCGFLSFSFSLFEMASLGGARCEGNLFSPHVVLRLVPCLLFFAGTFFVPSFDVFVTDLLC
jgi:hypothetical protein